jgi:hypothetical protein
MIRKLGLVAALFALLLGPADVLARGGHSSHSHSSGTSHSSHSKEQSEHVGGHYRKDGKYVHPYHRHPSGTKPTKKKSSGTHSKTKQGGTKSTHSTHSSDHANTNAQRDANGKIHRSAHAKNEFKKSHPSPSRATLPVHAPATQSTTSSRSRGTARTIPRTCSGRRLRKRRRRTSGSKPSLAVLKRVNLLSDVLQKPHDSFVENFLRQ